MRYPETSVFPFLQTLGVGAHILIAIILIWIIVIKGIALWKAAQNNEKWWFIALLVVNSVGILELVYIIWFSKKGLSLTETTLSEKKEG